MHRAVGRFLSSLTAAVRINSLRALVRCREMARFGPCESILWRLINSSRKGSSRQFSSSSISRNTPVGASFKESSLYRLIRMNLSLVYLDQIVGF